MRKKGVLYNYLISNKKNFLIIIGVFFIGMLLGIFTINHTSDNKLIEVNSYINSICENLQNSDGINKTECLIKSVFQNTIFVIIMWLLGCTIIGSVLVYVCLIYKGFSLGYTISAVISALGAKSGTIFVFASLLIQNIIYLPAIFMLAESGIKLYLRISKNLSNIKQELLRHTVIMLISLILSVISSILEVYLSTNILIFFKKIV
jgi:stage II sporulation protein M